MIAAVELADIKEIKHKEIAQMMGISESGVKVELNVVEKNYVICWSVVVVAIVLAMNTPQNMAVVINNFHRTYAVIVFMGLPHPFCFRRPLNKGD